MENYDKVIVGAGFYGLYSALFCGRKGQKVLILEKEKEAFTRASHHNQARVHRGYHYPRSISTAIKSAGYFERFCEDYRFCINKDFKQIYATSSRLSWTDESDFEAFCSNAGISSIKIDTNQYFKPGMCDGAFQTTEYTYDAHLLKESLLREIDALANIRIEYGHFPERIERKQEVWEIHAQEIRISTPFILNSAYAAVNDVLKISDGGGVSTFQDKV